MGWLVWGLLALHLICVNLAAGGPLAMVLVRGRQLLDPPTHALGNRVIRWIHVAFAASVLSGLALLALRWSMHPGEWRDVWWPAFRGKLYWGIGELVSFVVAWSAASLVWRRSSMGSRPGWIFPLLAAFATANLLYHFPPLFTLLAGAEHHQLELTGALTAAAFRRWAFTPEVASLWLHVTLAALAHAMLFIAWLAARQPSEKSSSSASSLQPWVVRGCRWGGAITALQLVVGFGVLASQPAEWQRAWIGGDLVATSLMIASIVATAYVAHGLSEAFWAVPDLRSTQRALLITTAIVIMMTGALVRARELRPQANFAAYGYFFSSLGGSVCSTGSLPALIRSP